MARHHASIIRSWASTAAAALALGVLLPCAATRAAADTFYVDGANPAAVDVNPGTEAQPYKTIFGALKLRAYPGNTILVKPAVYREQVVFPGGGAAGSPLVVRATGPGVVLDGADDFSVPALWSNVGNGAFLAASVTWAPLQVMANGARLDATTMPLNNMPTNSFEYVSGTGLYVNLGGDNPGGHPIFVGHRASAFSATGKSYLTIQGFTITRTESRSISLTSGSSFVSVLDDTISYSNDRGIYVLSSSNEDIERCQISNGGDHGIFLSGVNNSLVRGNESFGNARPATRAANGIYLASSTLNRFENNNLHHNQDTGLNLYNGANYNVCVGNWSWANGDHGYDNLGAIGNTYVNNVAYHNYKDGWSIEGSSPNNQLYNSISIDNGLTTGEYDLWVDASSTSGFVSNFNIFWNSASGNVVKYGNTKYSSVALYAAVNGNDARSLQSDPRFANAAAGDFHLLAGSPAIDDATSAVANWPAVDAAGTARADDPATPNTGTGPVIYADRGVFEYVPPYDPPPVVSAPANAGAAENQPFTLTISASDDQPLQSLTADLSHLPPGNNAVFTVNGSRTSGTLTWTPGYADAPGPYPVTFTASNALSTSATTSIAVANVDRAPAVTATSAAEIRIGQQVSIPVTASDPDGDAIASLTADLSAFPANNLPTFTTASGNGSGTFTWTPALTTPAGRYNVTFTASNALSGNAVSAITVVLADRAPVVTAPASAAGAQARALSFTVTATDPDNDAIGSLTANLAALPAGNNATFVVNPAHTMGTFTWTPTVSDGPGPYAITFTASNLLSGSATTSITVDRTPVVSVPSTTSVGQSQTLSLSVTANDPDGDALSALTADLHNLPAGANASFTPNPTFTAGTLTWTPTFADGPGPYVVTFTASNALSGSAATSIAVSHTDRAPVVTAPATFTAQAAQACSLTVTVADPDGDAIGALTADLSAFPAGSNARFTAGNGNTSGTLTWTPQAADVRTAPYPVSFAATNALSGVATTAINVVTLCGNPSFESSIAGWEAIGSATLTRVSGGHDGAWALEIRSPSTATYGIGDNPNWVASVPVAGTRYHFTAWVRAANPSGTARLKVRELLNNVVQGNASYSTAITLTTAWQQAALDFVAAQTGSTLDLEIDGTPVASGDAFQVDDVAILATPPAADNPPVVSVPSAALVTEGNPLTITVNASDPDGQQITSLTANLTGLPATNNATFTTNGARTVGTFTWTPAIGDARSTPYTVTFTASNALSSTASVAITVDPQTTNLVGNPSFEVNLSGWNGASSATVARVSGGHTGGWAAQLTAPAGTSAFGLNDSPNWVTSTGGTGMKYRYTAWVRSAANTGAVRLKLREYTPAGAQVGSTAQSSAVTLSPTWQQVTLDYTAMGGGNSLDFQVLDTPVAAGEVFLVDDVSIVNVTTSARSGLPSAPAALAADGAPLAFAARFAPNPARLPGRLWFATTREGAIRARLYDASGRLVATLLDTPHLAAGVHEVAVDGVDARGRRVDAGVYFYRVEAAEGVRQGRVVVVP